MTFGENIANRRKENGLTQEQLAKQVCVSRPMIAQIERGSKAPTVPLALHIARVLNCSLMDLVVE